MTTERGAPMRRYAAYCANKVTKLGAKKKKGKKEKNDTKPACMQIGFEGAWYVLVDPTKAMLRCTFGTVFAAEAQPTPTRAPFHPFTAAAATALPRPPTHHHLHHTRTPHSESKAVAGSDFCRGHSCPISQCANEKEKTQQHCGANDQQHQQCVRDLASVRQYCRCAAAAVMFPPEMPLPSTLPCCGATHRNGSCCLSQRL